MIGKTYRRVTLAVFLNKTLGGFAEPADLTATDRTILEQYRAGVKVDIVHRLANVSMPTMYARLRRMNEPLRSEAA